jgi:hypothetical protein
MFDSLLHRVSTRPPSAVPRPTAFAHLERVSGPFKGYFLAAYAVPAGPAGFVAYYKVCNGPPASYWEACCLVKGRSRDASDLAGALHEAEELGLVEIRNLPSLHQLAAWRECRSFYRFELCALMTGERLRDEAGA